MQSLRSFLIVFSLELLLRAAFLLKSAFHCFILLLGIKFSSELESDEWPCKGPGWSRTGIPSLIGHGEKRRAGTAHSLLGAAVCLSLLYEPAVVTCPAILGILKRLPT